MPGLQPDGSRLPRRSRNGIPSLQSRDPAAMPSPTSPRNPRAGEPPRGHGALTCREPGSGAAPRSSRGSGQAGGRPAGGRAGRSASESPAPIAELSLLGHLTPALPAGRGGRPLARLPVGRWRPSGGARGVHAGCGRRAVGGAAAARKRRGQDRAAGVGGEGAVPSPLVTPARHSPRPRPGAPPPQPLRAGPRARRAGGGDEGNLKSLRSHPSAPPPQAPPPGPPAG